MTESAQRTGRLENKVAIVTGAGRGIGRGIALRFGDEGAKVVIASRTGSRVDEVVREIEGRGGTAIGITCDVGDQDQIKSMVARTVEAFGAVDILANVAQGFGTAQEPAGSPVITPLEDYRDAEWEFTFRTGATATLWAMKAVFPHMKGRGGRIINFGSKWGVEGYPGSVAYNATKEAIRALTRTGAREWGKYGIRVNCINPVIATDAATAVAKDRPDLMEHLVKMTPAGRLGEPYRDAGGLALFLASEESDFMTGHTFPLDGGYSIYG
jgi:NAD(P)-dependent dehydrogenase (short-subunit alcohol dehydrogenase family)